jgi:chromate reductase, NAD(P)H dehydrogenase (quinone)
MTVQNKQSIRILAISGSLRCRSSNTALVEAAVRLAPAVIDMSIYRELAALPPFNPDVASVCTPSAVARFRAQLAASDAVLISSPEYAHGIPGVLKNALDWVVGSGELVHKPIALINASGRATHAWTSLRETLTVMSAHVIAAASLRVPLDAGTIDETAIAGDARLVEALRTAIGALVFAVLERRTVHETTEV